MATKERKVMSSKTFFKRVAITATAALSFGLLSVAPSQAAVTSHTLTIDSATDSVTTGDTATAVLTHSFVNLGAATAGARADLDSVTVQAVITSSNASTAGTINMRISDSYTSLGNDATSANSPRYAIIGKSNITAWASKDADTGNVNGSGQDSSTSILAPGNGANNLTDSFTVNGSAVGANKSIGSVVTLQLKGIAAAGTYTVSIFTQKSDAGAALSATGQPSVTWTITVTDPVKTATANSTVTLRSGATYGGGGTFFAGTAESTDSSTTTAATSDTTDVTPEFTVITRQKSSTSTTTAQESYTVTVSGEAYLTAGTNAAGALVEPSARPVGAAGLKTLTMATSAADTSTLVHVWSTGTAGTATITLTTVSGLVLGTKTVTFFGDVASLTVMSAYIQKKIVRAGGFASSTLFYVEAKDSAGNRVKDVNPTIVSSNVAVITGGSCTDAVGASSDGIHTCTVNSAVGSTSGQTATLTIRTLDPARAAGTTSYLTATYSVSLGGAVATEVITLDKTSYEPGDWMVVTITAKDASGNPVYDDAAVASLSASKALGGTITMTTTLAGVAISAARSGTTGLITNNKNLGAPSASGKFLISGTSVNTAGDYISVTGTVGDDAATAAAAAATDAALEAIDAANAATDAANLAAEAADAATVAAEEARDAADAATAAVEALATEVATLMAALKAQITTLANTVAKIAKKVKA